MAMAIINIIDRNQFDKIKNFFIYFIYTVTVVFIIYI